MLCISGNAAAQEKGEESIRCWRIIQIDPHTYQNVPLEVYAHSPHEAIAKCARYLKEREERIERRKRNRLASMVD